MSLPVLVINRDQDVERLEAFRHSVQQHGVGFERIPALDAHAPDFPFANYVDLIGDHFWGEPVIKPGAVGCFLSHRKAWQHVLDHDLPLALICEDDAIFLKSPSELSALVADAGGFDIVFANQRLSLWAQAVSDQPAATLPDVVNALAVNGGPTALGLKPTPGGDCYLVSNCGAARLIAVTGQQRIVCGVDWSMVWNALPAVTNTQAAVFPELGILMRHLPPMLDPLTAIVLSDPIADQSGRGGSTIRHAITRPISEIAGQ